MEGVRLSGHRTAGRPQGGGGTTRVNAADAQLEAERVYGADREQPLGQTTAARQLQFLGHTVIIYTILKSIKLIISSET